MSAFVLHDVSHASPTINVEFSDDGGTFVLGRAHVPRKNCHVSRAQAHLRANSGYILDPSSSLLIGTSSLILESCGLHSTGVLSCTGDSAGECVWRFLSKGESSILFVGDRIGLFTGPGPPCAVWEIRRKPLGTSSTGGKCATPAPANVQEEEPRHEDLLLRAVQHGDLNVLSRLISTAGAMSACGLTEDAEESPICVAIAMGDARIVQLLVEAGAAPSRFRLHEACMDHACSLEDALSFALRDDAPADVVLALLPSCRGTHGRMELLDPSIDLSEAFDGDGASCLHLAAARGVGEDQHQVLSLLLALGVPPDVRHRRTARTPLHAAVEWGNLESAATLLKAGAAVEAEDADGCTPLGLSADSPEPVGFVRLLLAAAASANATSRAGDHPLAAAVLQGHRECARLLRKAGGDVNQSARGPLSPICLAAQAGCTDSVHALLAARAEVTPDALLHAATSGSLDVLIMLLKVSPLDWDSRSKSLLLAAAANGRTGVVVHLCRQTGLLGACTRWRSRDHVGDTALCAAARHGHLGVVQALIRHFPSDRLGVPNLLGETPLHLSFSHGHLDCASILMAGGAQADDNELRVHVACFKRSKMRCA